MVWLIFRSPYCEIHTHLSSLPHTVWLCSRFPQLLIQLPDYMLSDRLIPLCYHPCNKSRLSADPLPEPTGTASWMTGLSLYLLWPQANPLFHIPKNALQWSLDWTLNSWKCVTVPSNQEASPVLTDWRGRFINPSVASIQHDNTWWSPMAHYVALMLLGAQFILICKVIENLRLRLQCLLYQLTYVLYNFSEPFTFNNSLNFCFHSCNWQ